MRILWKVKTMKSIQIKIDNRIHVPITRLSKSQLKILKDLFRHTNHQFFMLQRLGKSTYGMQRSIPTFYQDKDTGTISVPRGGLKRLEDLLNEAGIVYRLRWKLRSVPVSEPFTFDPNFCFRDYQIEAIREIAKHRTCLIRGAAGSGKTEILLGAIAEAGERAGVVVTSTALFEQWLERIEKRLGIPKKQIGQIRGGKKKRIGDQITVIMLQSAVKMIPNLWDQFGFIANDEVHKAAAQTNFRLIDSFDAAWRVGASATIKRQDLRHPLTHDLFGPVAFSIGRQELESQDYLEPISLVICETDFYFDYLNEDFLAKHFPNEMDPAVKRAIAKREGLPENEHVEYVTACSRDRDRNNLIFRHVKREWDEGSSCLVFVRRIEQLKMWSQALDNRGIKNAPLWARTGKRETRRLIAALKTGEIRIAIGTVLDEGIDIPAMDCGFLTYRIKNRGLLEQQAGRLARKQKGKNKARFYYFWDHKITRFQDDPSNLSRQFGRSTGIKEARKLKV